MVSLAASGSQKLHSLHFTVFRLGEFLAGGRAANTLFQIDAPD
jgi:hypothetical protein